jgi:hypothetical protein
MRLGSDQLGCGELPRVAQTDSFSRMDTNPELAPGGCRQEAHHLEARLDNPTLDLTGH